MLSAYNKKHFLCHIYGIRWSSLTPSQWLLCIITYAGLSLTKESFSFIASCCKDPHGPRVSSHTTQIGSNFSGYCRVKWLWLQGRSITPLKYSNAINVVRAWRVARICQIVPDGSSTIHGCRIIIVSEDEMLWDTLPPVRLYVQVYLDQDNEPAAYVMMEILFPVRSLNSNILRLTNSNMDKTFLWIPSLS